jgi:hypothetical protein
MPFVPPPFGLVLMLTLSLSLAAYLRIIRRSVPLLTMLNILEPTFVLPLVLVQPVDQLISAHWDWALILVSIAYIVVLLWER